MSATLFKVTSFGPVFSENLYSLHGQLLLLVSDWLNHISLILSSPEGEAPSASHSNLFDRVHSLQPKPSPRITCDMHTK